MNLSKLSIIYKSSCTYYQARNKNYLYHFTLIYDICHKYNFIILVLYKRVWVGMMPI